MATIKELLEQQEEVNRRIEQAKQVDSKPKPRKKSKK